MTGEIGAKLVRLSDLLREGDEPNWAGTVQQLARSYESATQSGEKTQELHRVLGLYSGGMGGFLDVVLQNQNGVLPIQDEFDRLRHALYMAVRDELRSEQ